MHASGTPTGGSRIVVGYDGSEASRRALEEAARRTGPAGQLYVVHCFHAPAERYGAADISRKMVEEETRAQAVLDGLAANLPPGLSDVRWETELLAGPAADAIVRVASVRDADEILIGSRGAGRARALLGSVAHDVLHQADRPVVVIPERAVKPAAAAGSSS